MSGPIAPKPQPRKRKIAAPLPPIPVMEPPYDYGVTAIGLPSPTATSTVPSNRARYRWPYSPPDTPEKRLFVNGQVAADPRPCAHRRWRTGAAFD